MWETARAESLSVVGSTIQSGRMSRVSVLGSCHDEHGQLRGFTQLTSSSILSDGPRVQRYMAQVIGTRTWTTTSSGAGTFVDGEQEDLGHASSVSSVPERKVGFWPLTTNLIVGGLGTGMLSLPWSVAGASTLPGLLTIFLVILVNIFTIDILVRAAEKHDVFDLGGLLGKLPGRLGVCMQILFNVSVWGAVMFTLVGYIITIHDCAVPFVDGTSLGRSRLPAVALGCAMVLPLCFLDQRYLSFTSLAAVGTNLYVVGIITGLLGIRALRGTLPAGACNLGFGLGNVSMVSAMMQCVIIQMCVLPMYRELEDRSPGKFIKALTIAFGVLTAFFGIFAVSAYWSLGVGVKSNALLSLPRNVFSQIAWVGMVIVVAAVYPIMMICMVAPLECLDPSWFMKAPHNEQIVASRKRMTINSCIVIIVLISGTGALFIRSLGIINVISGAFCTGIFTALGPGLVGLFLLDNEQLRWKCAMITLIGVGSGLAVVGCVLVKNFEPQLEADCIW